MSPSLFPFRDEGKRLQVKSIRLLARSAIAENYSVILEPHPATALAAMTLARATRYGGLHFCQTDVADEGIDIAPAAPAAKWRVTMTRSGGGNLEVEDLLLLLGYEWE